MRYFLIISESSGRVAKKAIFLPSGDHEDDRSCAVASGVRSLPPVRSELMTKMPCCPVISGTNAILYSADLRAPGEHAARTTARQGSIYACSLVTNVTPLLIEHYSVQSATATASRAKPVLLCRTFFSRHSGWAMQECRSLIPSTRQLRRVSHRLGAPALSG
jgi:hypothetical protein